MSGLPLTRFASARSAARILAGRGPKLVGRVLRGLTPQAVGQRQRHDDGRKCAMNADENPFRSPYCT